jgi:hypothetical protein
MFRTYFGAKINTFQIRAFALRGAQHPQMRSSFAKPFASKDAHSALIEKYWG